MDKTYIIYNLVKLTPQSRFRGYSTYTYKRGGDYNFRLGYVLQYFYNFLHIPVLVKEKLNENGKVAVIMRGYRES